MRDKSVAEVRRRCQISTTPYFTWRKEAREAIKAHLRRRKQNQKLEKKAA
jgi:hypothetical protein